MRPVIGERRLWIATPVLGVLRLDYAGSICHQWRSLLPQILVVIFVLQLILWFRTKEREEREGFSSKVFSVKLEHIVSEIITL